MQISINPFKHYHHTRMNRLCWWTKGLKFAAEKYLGTPLNSTCLSSPTKISRTTHLAGMSLWYAAGSRYQVIYGWYRLYVPANTDGVMGKFLLYFDHWSFDPTSSAARNQHHLAPCVQVQGLLCSDVVGNAAAESMAAASRRRAPGMNFQKVLGW